eukprot:6476278-Amphidinium_carterae.1
MATTADVRNPFALSDQEPMDGEGTPMSDARDLRTVRTLHTHELDEEEGMPDFDGDDLEMVPTPPPTQEEVDSPGSLYPPSPPEDGPFSEEEVPPPPTMEAVPTAQMTRELIREEIDDDSVPLTDLANPPPLATQVLTTPVPKGSVAKVLRSGTPPPIPDLTADQRELLDRCFTGVSDVPVGNAH